MRKERRTYKPCQLFSAVLMILALAWLTVSTPFVYRAQQQASAIEKKSSSPLSGTEEESANPFANTTEEKTPNNISLTEEYLHHHDDHTYFLSNKLNHSHCHTYDVYVAYHGELLSPPPEV